MIRRQRNLSLPAGRLINGFTSPTNADFVAAVRNKMIGHLPVNLINYKINTEKSSPQQQAYQDMSYEACNSIVLAPAVVFDRSGLVEWVMQCKSGMSGTKQRVWHCLPAGIKPT